MLNRDTIKNGIYLVIDPAMQEEVLLSRLAEALGTGKVAAVQLWDHWEGVKDKGRLIEKIKSICSDAAVPLLMNNDWQTAQNDGLDGVHFDVLPDMPLSVLRETVGKSDFLIGLTLGNDLSLLDRPAIACELDYLSFCSVFPSASAGECEIVSTETIKKARSHTHLPIFLSGGINVSSIPHLAGLSFDGVAVISGIMRSPTPAAAIEEIADLLTKIKRNQV